MPYPSTRRFLDPFRDAVFRSPAFLRLTANGATNGISVGADYVLVGWLALQAADSSAWVGGGFALYHLPGLLLGVPAGSLADRLDRRQLIRNLELAGMAMLVGFGLLIGSGYANIAVIYGLTISLGCLRAVHHPIRLAYAYDVAGAERVVPAMAALKFATQLGYIVGAALVGITAERLGTEYALATMALAHVLAWACLSGPRVRGVRGIDPTPILDNLRDYAREMVRNRLLAALVMVTAGVEIFGTSLSTVLPELAEGRLRVGADGLGWLIAISHVGGLMAAMGLFLLPQARDARAVWLLSMVGLGVAVIALGAAPSFAVCAIALGASSAMISAWDILTQSMMQLAVPDRLRGRAMGAWMFAIGSAPVGHLQMGFLAVLLGVDKALYFNGAMVLVVIALALVISPALRPRPRWR